MEWIKLGYPKADELLRKEGATIIVSFDNGEIRMYDDEWPFAEATHVMEIIKPI